MLVTDGFNQTNIALIFQLKWVIYMSNITFCLIKTCALIQKAPNTAMNLEHFRRQSTLNVSQAYLQSNEYCAHVRGKII